MSRRLPPLNALRVFEAAARQGSFARAAKELHVTPAAISQQIKILEDYLGVILFTRGKALTLSESADAVLPQLSDAFDQIERAMARVRAGNDKGPLVVSVPPAFAARWLIPRLDDFHAHHPEVDLHLMATQRLVDFNLEDVDVAIRFGAGKYPGLRVERLMAETIMAVAAPKLAAKIKKPAELLRCTLLEDKWHVDQGLFPDWKTWLATLGVNDKITPRIQGFGGAGLAIQAAVSGLGVTLAWRSLVIDDISAKRLRQVLDHSTPSTLGYHFVAPENNAALGKVQAFRSWLLAQVAR